MIAAPPRPLTRFSVPAGREASLPPERRGVERDNVRLLLARPGKVSHHVFRELPSLLEPGDLVVVNTSATLAAALRARHLGSEALVHVGGWIDEATWIVEPRQADNRGPRRDVATGAEFELEGGVALTLGNTYPAPAAGWSRLWLAKVTPGVALLPYLRDHGRPIAYRHGTGGLALSDHQNVYATEPGSAEMASAGRPFTSTLITRLVAAGIVIAPLILHAGVSSAESHEPPAPERFAVPEDTARLVRQTRAAGRRVVAVGTTVVRALETAAGADGSVRAGYGWTDLVLGPGRPARVVTGLVTGLHLPESSHLLLLEAVAGAELVRGAYEAAVEHQYLWHEFGDSMLFLP